MTARAARGPVGPLIRMNVTAHSEAPSVDSQMAIAGRRRWLLLGASFWWAWLAFRSLAPVAARYGAEVTPLIPLIAFAFLWLLAAVGGSRMLRAVRITGIGPGEHLFFASLLGFAAISLCTFLLAAAHSLRAPVLCIGLGLAGLYLAITLRPGELPAFEWRQWWQSLRGAAPAQQCALGLLALACLLGVAGAMAPATDNDTLLYHLAAPSIYVQHHGFVYVPHNLWTNIPLFTEMIYSAGLCVMNQTLARLFVPCSYLLLLVGCWCFCRRHLPHASPWMPALLVGSIPLLAILNCTNLNDITLLAYQLGSLYAFVNFWRAGNSSERRGWLLVCALACGGSAAIKYIGWLPGMVLLPAALWRMAALERWRGVLPASGTVLVALVLPGLWLAKNVVYTGNPVYPLAFSVFGGRNWSAALAAEYQAHMMSFGVHDEGLLGALKAPLLLVLDEARFGSKLGVGPIFLLLTPVALWAATRLSRCGRFLFGYALLHYALWALGPQATRYILPGLLVWSFVLGESVGRLPGRPPADARRRWRPEGPRALVRGIVCAAAAFNIGWFAVTQQALLRPFDAVCGVANRRAYLQREVPYYSTISYANAALRGADKVLFVGEWRTFYTQIPFASDTGPDATIICEYINRSHNVDELLAALRRDGFTHLLYNPEAEALLQRTFGYLRFASPEKERLYRQLPGYLRLVHAEHGVFLYELERSQHLTTVGDSQPA